MARRAPNGSKRNGTAASATSVGRAAAERLAPSFCNADAFLSSVSERSRAARSASCARRKRRSDETLAAVKSASMSARTPPPTRIARADPWETSLPRATMSQRRPPSSSERTAPVLGLSVVAKISVPPKATLARTSSGRSRKTLPRMRRPNHALTKATGRPFSCVGAYTGRKA
jgi:hypothetical protein